MKNDILIRPVITEKSMAEATKSRYVFAVVPEANKAEIAQAVGTQFNVKVLSVKTLMIKGKTKRSGRTRQVTKTGPWKKAVVEVQKGQKIDLFDVAEQEHTHA